MSAAAPALVEKIRKLLNLSRGTANEHEAALAGEKVRQLLEEHNLSLLQVELSQAESAEEVVRVRIHTPGYEKLMAVTAAAISDCEVIHLRIQGSRRGRIVAAELRFCGIPANARAAAELFGYFKVEAHLLYRRHEISKIADTALRNAYLLGVAARIQDEAEKLKTKAEKTSTQTSAIVRVGSSIARRHMEEKYPNRKSGGPATTKYTGVYQHGYKDGAAVAVVPGKNRLAAGGAS